MEKLDCREAARGRPMAIPMKKFKKILKPEIPEKEKIMDIGDKVQHFGTGSIGTVIDSSYEVETPFQQLCVQWEDDKAPHKDSWERRESLAIAEQRPYDFSICK